MKKNDIKSSFDDARDAFVSSKWKADKALLLLREKRTQAVRFLIVFWTAELRTHSLSNI